MIEKVERFKTSDGKLFDAMDGAERHEEYLAAIDRANGLLQAGGNLFDVLSEVYAGPYDAVLRNVTKDTKLVISHWQCRDDPGYQVSYIDSKGIYVWGSAGSWSGPYGSYVSAMDLARYAAASGIRVIEAA